MDEFFFKIDITIIRVGPKISTEQVKFLHLSVIITKRVVVLSNSFFILDFHNCDV